MSFFQKGRRKRQCVTFFKYSSNIICLQSNYHSVFVFGSEKRKGALCKSEADLLPRNGLLFQIGSSLAISGFKSIRKTNLSLAKLFSNCGGGVNRRSVRNCAAKEQCFHLEKDLSFRKLLLLEGNDNCERYWKKVT